MSYYKAVRALVEQFSGAVRGMAHITGGGMRDNLIRIMLVDDLRAKIDLSLIRALPIFGLIKKYANATEADMLRTFNNGVGMIAVTDGAAAGDIIKTLGDLGYTAYQIGGVERGPRAVEFINEIGW